MMFGNNPGTNETWKHIPKNSVGVELGVWKGDSTEKFLKRANLIHAVDAWSYIPYQETDEFGNYENYLKRYSKLTGSSKEEDFQKYYDKIYNSVKNRFKGKPVIIHRCSTNFFFDNFKDKVDWVYVDASHAYGQCLKDLLQSIQIIKPGGILFGDDYSDAKPGVKAAVDQFLKMTGYKIDNFYQDQYRIRV